MNLTILKDTPPWNWSEGTGKMLLDVLRDEKTEQPDLLLAAELAGDCTVINDELVHALLSLLSNRDKSENLRGTAAIALGPILELADMEGFEDPDDLPIVEHTFHTIQESLRRFYLDDEVSKEVRRQVLEASVRAPQDWHQAAVRDAYRSEDEAWKLTAVFCMRFVRGFDNEILAALDSKNPEIQYEAVIAAGTWELDSAWPHVAALVTSRKTDKPLLLAAIEAVSGIRPHEATKILGDLLDSDDEDIVGAVEDAMARVDVLSGEDGDEDDIDEDLV